MRKSIGLCSWRALAGGLAVGVIAWSVSVDAASRNAGARDKGQVKSAATRLVTSPVNQVGEQIRDQGGVASAATIKFRWLPAQVGSYPAGTSGADTADLTFPGAGSGGQPLWLAIYIGNWGPNSPAFGGRLKNYQGQLDASSLPAGLAPWRPFCADDDDPLNDPDAADEACFALMGPGIGAGCDVDPINADECAPAFQDFTRADITEVWGFPGCNIATDSIKCGANVGAEANHVDPGTEEYGATIVLLAEESLVGGPHSIEFVAPDGDTFMNDGTTTVKVNSATLTIETGSCCFGIGTAGAGCDDDVSKTDCDGRAPLVLFRPTDRCTTVCAECIVDADCGDGNDCTDDSCDGNNICQHDDIAGWNQAEDCCNPVGATFTTIDDEDPCTDDSCDEGSGLGVATHVGAQAGTVCNDDVECTHTDVCGDKDGICAGTDINEDDCTDDAFCIALIDGTTCDPDTGKCSCSPVVDMFCNITAGKLGKNAECIGGVNDGGVCTDDDDCLGQANPPIFDGVCDNQACFHLNAKVDAFVHIGPSVTEINGYQVTVVYDPSCMQVLRVDPVPPYTQVLDTQIDEAAGEIFMAAGVAFGAGNGPFGDADLFSISWLKTGECSTCQCCFGGANPVNTYLTDAEGQPVNVETECSQTVVSAGTLSLDIPDSMKTNVGCDSFTADVTWDPPSAADSCTLREFACAAHHAQQGKILDDLIMSGGEHGIGDATYCCWATDACNAFVGFKAHDPRNNPAEGCWTVTINDETTLDIEIEVSPTMDPKLGGGLTRCIKFEGFKNCVQGPVVFERDLVFGGAFNFIGHSVGEIKGASGQFACLTARDQMHSLRGCCLRSDGCLGCVDGAFFATFKGDPFFGGNWLVNGNLDGWKKDNPDASRDVIDIQDFGQFVFSYLQCYNNGNEVACSDPTNGNTPCGTEGPNADINGDGIADLLDFSFVSLNFLVSSKDCCCPGSTGNTVGRTAISVVELRQMGLSDLIVADLNNDGMVDLNDMSAFLSGQVPDRKSVQHRSGLRSAGRK